MEPNLETLHDEAWALMARLDACERRSGDPKRVYEIAGRAWDRVIRRGKALEAAQIDTERDE